MNYNKTKIMIVGPIPPPLGGIALYVKKILNSKLIKKDNHLILFNTAIPSHIRRFDKRNERSYSSFSSDGFIPGLRIFRYVFFNFFNYYQSLIDNKPKFIHLFTNSYWGFWRSSIYLFIARALGLKVIFHLLNAIDDFWIASGPLTKRLIKMSLKHSELLIVQSKGIKSFIKSISKTSCSVIYNGVDNDISIKNSDISDERTNLIFIGGLSKNKGVFDIIRAARRLSNRDYMFTFIGSGPIEEFLDYSKLLGVKEMTNFRGPVSDSDKIAILKDSHILLLPSYAEGQPVAILEGMAAGLPIITTNVGSISEIIINNVNGYTIQPGNIDLLCDKIIELRTNQSLYNQISKNNLQDVRKKYRLERVFNEINDNYKTIIN